MRERIERLRAELDASPAPEHPDDRGERQGAIETPGDPDDPDGGEA